MSSTLTLGNLIKILENEPPEKVIPFGFLNPHSYRGYYEDLAFTPARNVTIGQMLESAKNALGNAFFGWKGGEYEMDEWTEIWIAEDGKLGETLGPILLAFMLGHSP